MSEEGLTIHVDDMPRIFRSVRHFEDSVQLPQPRQRRVLSSAQESGEPVWELWTQTTGGHATSGSFELLVTHPDAEGGDTESTIDVDWNQTAESLQTALNDLNGITNVAVSKGPLDRRNLVITLGNGGMKDLQIGINDLTSGRPYLLYKSNGKEETVA